MSKRTTFSDVKKGTEIEIRKDADTKGVIKKVNAVDQSRYGTKISLGDNFVFVVENVQAQYVTEFFDSRNKYLYIVKQPTATKSSE